MQIKFSPEVAKARLGGLPLVALESTVIAQGLPYPQNMETALAMENAVRNAGAVPATIAILKGIPHCGLTEAQIEHLATSKEISKASIRDLPVVAARKTDGATTVSSTMFVANRADIQVFATGGIGGVHRGIVPDVSADLPALASIPMTVVCSGAKIVLDLPATREWLETHAVCVLGWQTDEFPAFYTRRSGLDIDARVENAAEAMEIARKRSEFGIKSAILCTVPVPVEFETDPVFLEKVLEKALEDANTNGISGKQITPFLLSRMAELSDGKTIETNISLLINNASIGGKLALAFRDES